MGSRAPESVNPKRSASPYLPSAPLRCETCGNAVTAAEAKSGKYTYRLPLSAQARKRNLQTPIHLVSWRQWPNSHVRAGKVEGNALEDIVLEAFMAWATATAPSLHSYRFFIDPQPSWSIL